MGNLIDNIPEILEKSASLFGIFALAALILAFVGFLLFRNSGTKQKERVFIYLTLFLLALVLSSLTVGIFSGFERGSEVVTTQVEEDPLWVKLSPSTVQKLEKYIASSGKTVTDESKTRTLAIAVDAYLAPREEISYETKDSSSTPTSPESDSNASISRDSKDLSHTLTSSRSDSNASTPMESVVDGFLFQLRGCSRTHERVKCSFLVTNEERDETLYLYAKYGGIISRIITPQGSQLIANKVKFGGYESTSYIYNVNLVKNVGLAAEISFEGVPQQVNQLALIELTLKSSSSGRFTVQFRDVPISS